MSVQKNQSTSLSILGFVPSLVTQYFLKTAKMIRRLPECQNLRSVVMFADISGFTNLTEMLSKIGSEGSEVIAFAINRYMEFLVQAIGRSGGDIFKFAGDAIIVLWPPSDSQDTEVLHTQLQIMMRQAIQSALDIQDKLNNTNIIDKIQLSVKIGFGVGDINIIYVGGVFNRCEYIATGDPLIQAFESEHHAEKGGEIIVSRQVYEMVEEFFDFIKIEENGHKSKNGPFYYVKDFKIKKVRMKADALKIKNNLTTAGFELIKPSIMQYIPAALNPYIEIDQELWASELRRLSVMFVSLGINLSVAETTEGLNRIQQVIETVQKCVYYHQGSVNKLLMDDKGSTLIVVFGLPPFSHQDDPIRAILCGYSLKRELGKIDCRCSIGVSTGTVFAGIIGTSGSRREYSILGDSVNLAARLMQLAQGESTPDIICCEVTAYRAQHKLILRFYRMVKLKGKEKELPVYEPRQMTSEEVKQITKVEFLSDIKTHQNSLIMDDQMQQDSELLQRVLGKYFHIVGRTRELKDLEQIFDRFMRRIDNNGFSIIRGSYGMGKSLLIRIALHRLKQNENKYIKQDKNIRQETLMILVSSIGPSPLNLKANGFRQILQQVFQQICQRRPPKDPKAVFDDIFLGSIVEEIHMNTMKELLGLVEPEWIQSFPPSPNQMPPSTEKQLQEMEALGNLTVTLLKQLTEEGQVSQSRIPTTPLDQSNNSILSDKEEKVPKIRLKSMVIVLEDLSLYDQLSFALILRTIKSFDRIIFLATVRNQFTEVQYVMKKKQDEDLSKKAQTQDQIFSRFLQDIEDELKENCFNTFDLKPLDRYSDVDEMKSLIRHHFKIEQFDYDTQKPYGLSIPEGQNEIIYKLKDPLLFQINKPYLWQQGATEMFLQYLLFKTGGNPLTIICTLQNMLRNKMIVISEKQPNKGVITEYCRVILDNDETTMFEAPNCWVQVNGPVIDKLSCLESLLLKSASVIGDIFDVQTLSKVQPFKDWISSEKLIKILQELEAQDLLEVMDINDHNIYYRFTYPFMREVIYQRMTYSQRRLIHRTVAEIIQAMPNTMGLDEYHEQKRLEFHWIVAESRWTTAQQHNPMYNDKFSHKARRSIIVKQIQQSISKSSGENVVLKQDMLSKRSDRNITWASRHVVISSRELRYYYNKEDHILGKEPLATIQLRYILGIFPLTQKEIMNKDFLHAFQIQTSSWSKKKSDMPTRSFYFATKDEQQLEEWVIYLEFAKAKAIYDEFIDNYGRITFPIKQIVDTFDQSIRMDLNTKQQKLNLGWQGLGERPQAQTLSRRASRVSTLGSLTRVSVKMKDTIAKEKDDAVNTIVQAQLEVTILKNMLKIFLRKSMLQLFSHLFEICLQKNEESFIVYGQNTKFAIQNKHRFDLSLQDRQLLRKTQVNQETMNIERIQDQKEKQANESESDEEISPPPPRQIEADNISGSLSQILSGKIIYAEASDTSIPNFSPPALPTINQNNSIQMVQPTNQSIQDVSPIARTVKFKEKSSINPSRFSLIGERKINNLGANKPQPLSDNSNSDYELNSHKTSIIILDNEQPITTLNEKSQLNVEGQALKECYSLKGCQFFLQKGDKVKIRKIYEHNNFIKCSFRSSSGESMTGIFKKTDIFYAFIPGLPQSLQCVAKEAKAPKLLIQHFDELNGLLKNNNRKSK